MGSRKSRVVTLISRLGKFESGRRVHHASTTEHGRHQPEVEKLF